MEVKADYFEAKKDAMRQVQSGDWKVTFTVQPGDMPDWFMKAEMGKHVVIGIVEVADDGQPVDQEKKEAAKRRYQEKDEPQKAIARAGILANDTNFQQWAINTAESRIATGLLGVTPLEKATEFIRLCCGVSSRADMATNPSALRLFLKLENEFHAYQRYGDVA